MFTYLQQKPCLDSYLQSSLLIKTPALVLTCASRSCSANDACLFVCHFESVHVLLIYSLILQVAELKAELKVRGLTVSGTKNDLIERLRNYQEQNRPPTAAAKNSISQPTTSAPSATSSPMTSATPEQQQAGEGGIRITLKAGQEVHQHQVMRFGSTSSSPPVSPTPSERSLAGMSPDETSCNGDMFGEMVRWGEILSFTRFMLK